MRKNEYVYYIDQDAYGEQENYNEHTDQLSTSCTNKVQGVFYIKRKTGCLARAHSVVYNNEMADKAAK